MSDAGISHAAWDGMILKLTDQAAEIERLRKIERMYEIKRDYLDSRLCMDHSGKWARDYCPFCDNERLRAELAEAREDVRRVDWLEREMFDGYWDGTLGRPKSWHMAGPYKHTLREMSGDSLRAAIDEARASHKEQP